MKSNDNKKRYTRTHDEWRKLPISLSKSSLVIGGWQVMQSWERPLMKAMAKEVTAAHGDVLEVGFGMGISAREIIRHGCRSYTVIEVHPEVAESAREWAQDQNVPMRIIQGTWQDVLKKDIGTFDGILFDTFEVTAKERTNRLRLFYPFIPVAQRILRKDGVLTYFSNETVDFDRGHLRYLLRHFDEVKLVNVKGLEPPEDCEYWHDDHMVIPVARKTIG